MNGLFKIVLRLAMLWPLLWGPTLAGLEDVIAGSVATRLNGAAFTTGKFGQAFFFDGVNDGIHLPASASLEIGAPGTGITLEAWIRPDDVNASRPIMELEGTELRVKD